MYLLVLDLEKQRSQVTHQNLAVAEFNLDSSLSKPSSKDTCSPVFIAALFTIARTWKQPRCPSTDECVRKLWYIYTMECVCQSLNHVRLCDPMNCSLSGSSTQEILPARISEWVAISFSAVKRNAFESVLMRWMNLEPIIKSLKSQKLYGNQKDHTDEPI